MVAARGVDQLLGKYLISKSNDFKQHVDTSSQHGLNSRDNHNIMKI